MHIQKNHKVNESQWFYVTAGTYYILLPLAIESVQSICLLHIIIFVLFLSLLYSAHKEFVLFVSNFSPSMPATLYGLAIFVLR